MAKTTKLELLLVLIVLSISLISVSARPCKTLFISTYSFTFRQPSTLHLHPSSSGYVGVFTEITRSSNPVFIPNDIVVPRVDSYKEKEARPLRHPFGMMSLLPSTTSSYDISSLRDRTKDILSVVVALLFGVGCGALTAATMYLAWSLLSSRGGDYRYSSSSPYDGDSDGNGNVDYSPKKVGYVKIPAESETFIATEPTKETPFTVN